MSNKKKDIPIIIDKTETYKSILELKKFKHTCECAETSYDVDLLISEIKYWISQNKQIDEIYNKQLDTAKTYLDGHTERIEWLETEAINLCNVLQKQAGSEQGGISFRVTSTGDNKLEPDRNISKLFYYPIFIDIMSDKTNIDIGIGIVDFYQKIINKKLKTKILNFSKLKNSIAINYYILYFEDYTAPGFEILCRNLFFRKWVQSAILGVIKDLIIRLKEPLATDETLKSVANGESIKLAYDKDTDTFRINNEFFKLSENEKDALKIIGGFAKVQHNNINLTKYSSEINKKAKRDFNTTICQRIGKGKYGLRNHVNAIYPDSIPKTS